MPTHGQRLGEEISHVPDAGNVLHVELKAANPILEPMKTHVARLRHFGLDGAIGQAHGDFIIAMNRRRRLRVAKVGEHLAFLVSDLGGCKRAPVLRFLNGRAHYGDARGVNGDGGVEKGGVVAARKMVKGPGHAASVGPGEEGCIGEDAGIGEDVEGQG